MKLDFIKHKVKQIMDLVYQLFIGFSLYKIVHDTREMGILDW